MNGSGSFVFLNDTACLGAEELRHKSHSVLPRRSAQENEIMAVSEIVPQSLLFRIHLSTVNPNTTED